MIHFGSFEIGGEIFVWILACVLLIIQLILCFKAKRNIIRLIPVMLFAGLTIVFLCLTYISEDWDSIGFFFLTITSIVSLIGCGISWGIYGINKAIKNNN